MKRERRVAFGSTVMLPPQHPREPFNKHCAVSLNYRRLLIDLNQNRRIIVAAERHHDILKSLQSMTTDFK